MVYWYDGCCGFARRGGAVAALEEELETEALRFDGVCDDGRGVEDVAESWRTEDVAESWEAG